MKNKILILLLSIKLTTLSAQEWNTTFHGIDSIKSGGTASIWSIENEGDSVIYIGGVFIFVNSQTVNGIFKWSPLEWNSYNNGVTLFTGAVETIKPYKNKLFIGGGFGEVNYLPQTENMAVWYDNSWHACELGEPSNDVYEFCIYHDTLFVGGRFSYIGPEPFQRIAAYDGNNWINIGSISGDYVGALEVYNDELYAGRIYGIVKYLGGTEWSYMFNGPEGYVDVMKVDTFNNFLYAGGAFYYINDTVLSSCLAMWDGFKWNSTGYEINCDLYAQAMAIYRGDVYVGGCFDTLVSGLPVNYIARWDGEKWDSVGSGANNAVRSLEVFQDTLWVGGYFTEIGGLPAYGLAKVFVPDTSCNYIKPRVFTLVDTFDLSEGQVEVQFYNNNAYVDSWDWNFDGLGTSDIKDPAFTFTDTGDFDIQVTVSHNSCVKIASKTIHIRNGAGIEEIEKAKLIIYPNPSQNNFTVKLDLPEKQKCELRITGLNGHTKTTIPVKSINTEINTTGWSKGTYICNLFMDGKLVKSEKLILN